MKKTKFSLFVLIPIITSIMLLSLSSCDGSYMDPGIMEETGSLSGVNAIIVSNNSSWLADANVSVSIRYASNTTIILRSGTCARYNSITFTDIPVGTYIVRIADGYGSTINSTSFTISFSQTAIFNFNGTSISRVQ